MTQQTAEVLRLRLRMIPDRIAAASFLCYGLMIFVARKAHGSNPVPWLRPYAPAHSRRAGLIAEVVRFVAGLPFDVAADAGSLVSGNLKAGKHGVDGCAQIGACDGTAIARAAVIHLPAIHKAAGAVEEIKIRRAGRAVSFGDFLAFIEEIRKCEPHGPAEFRHLLGSIVRVTCDVIRIDPNDGDAALLILLCKPDKMRKDVLHIRAMIAYEDHKQCRSILEVLDGYDPAVNVRQTKRRSFGAERDHRGRCADHPSLLDRDLILRNTRLISFCWLRQLF